MKILVNPDHHSLLWKKTWFLPKNFLCVEMPPLAQFSHYIRFTAQWVVSIRAKTSSGPLLDYTFWACCSSHGAVFNNQDWELRQKASMSLCLSGNKVNEPLWMDKMALCSWKTACSGCCPESGIKKEEDSILGDKAQHSRRATGTQGYVPRRPGMTLSPAVA